MKKVVSLIGRTNVGKSTIFNRLVGKNTAIVSELEGLTRDRKISEISFNNKKLDLVDTGGFFSSEKNNFEDLILVQAHEALNSSDLILFVVDSKTGLTPYDKDLALMLRKSGKLIKLIINKIDVKDKGNISTFNELGFKESLAVSAEHNINFDLLNKYLSSFAGSIESVSGDLINVCVLGKPNVGKSSTINSLLDQNRLIVSDISGTTIDSTDVQITWKKKTYCFIDTAGVRKKNKTSEKEEKISVIKSLQSLQRADICLLLLDPASFMKDQDMTLISQAKSVGKALLIGINKSDLINKEKAKEIKQIIDNEPLVKKIPYFFFSAKNKTGLSKVMKFIESLERKISLNFSTNKLNQILKKSLQKKSIPFRGKFKPKIRYVHQGGKNPHIIIIHGNSLDKLDKSYLRFLENRFTSEICPPGIQTKLKLVSSKNPYN
ncbi:MAG: ribosome biogenesis GTPase Der [Thiotrichales bacterium TMED285]|jgi:GTP-binding protein|nr:MAG: ribosome biogenesis GTPase Der [Thiotrichales bacterium TMED285]|tara:strand:- start:28507 stop:29811 length:1305 start_codon:yes stop_codon:yes gene_type:complete